MNILIADSGSTKTHWELLNTQNQTTTSFFTKGINPFYISSEDIITLLKNELPIELQTTTINKIFFYGAGCSQPEKIETVAKALNNIFKAEKIIVEHDLLAAAKATCKNEAGITCILGTGSNSCSYNGNEIIDNVPSLGFILGDEGSGAWFGRKLLQAYFYRELPNDLKKLFQQKYAFTKEEILNSIYSAKNPNSIVASYMPFISENKTHPFIHELLFSGFKEFILRMVLKYENHNILPIHFIGSVAYLNKDILKETLQQFTLQTGLILQSPMEGLITYHIENNL